MTPESAAPDVVRPFERPMPPIVAIGMSALSLAVISGVLVAGQIGGQPSLTLPAVLVVIGTSCWRLVSVAFLVRIRPFAWWRFRTVFGWTLLAYVLQSSVIEWSFVKNDVPGRPMAILSAGLVVFATVVPLMISFTTARYQDTGT
ncbi:MAG: hypothetical protein V9F03_09900 [Microthrixaceae bacterium]